MSSDTLNEMDTLNETMDTLNEKLSNCCDYFFRLSEFPDLSGKFIWSFSNSPNLISQQLFASAM